MYTLSSEDSSGADDISTKLLKQIKSTLIKPLKITINQALIFFL